MTENSGWYKGLLYAEEKSQEGWKISGCDYTEGWIKWESEGNNIYWFEEDDGFISGVLDYHRNQNHKTNKEFEALGIEFAQVIEDNFWELVLK